MGYNSQLTGSLTVTPERTTPEKTYPAELVKLAADNNVPLPELSEVNGFTAETIAELMNNSDIKYFLVVTEDSIDADGESGKMYEPYDIFNPLIVAAKKEGLLLNGEFIRAGERQGDVERFTFTDNILTTDTAKLVWSSNNQPVVF